MNFQSEQISARPRLYGLLVAILLVPTISLAQPRSETGRHKPVPPVVADSDSAALGRVTRTGLQTRKWHFGMSGGMVGGSDMFRVEVIDGPPVDWDPETGGGFRADRFTAALDRNFNLGLFLSRDLGRRWTVRADLAYSRMDVAAEALVGQVGAVYLFDRMDVLNLGLGMEARLTSAESYPFIQASLLLSSLGPVRADKLKQSNLGVRLGLGYLHTLNEVWGLRGEVRLARTGFSVGDYVPQSVLPDQPQIDYDTEDHLVFFEIMIGFQANI